MEGKLYEYFDERLFSHLPQDELRSGLRCFNLDQGGFTGIKTFAFFTVIFCCYLSFMSISHFPFISRCYFIYCKRSECHSIIINYCYARAHSERNMKKKKHVSSNGKRRQRSERKVFIYFEPFLSKQCYFE